MWDTGWYVNKSEFAGWYELGGALHHFSTHCGAAGVGTYPQHPPSIVGDLVPGGEPHSVRSQTLWSW